MSKKRRTAASVRPSENEKFSDSPPAQKSFFLSVTLHLAAIVILGLLVYANTVKAPFLFDDRYYIVNNPSVRSLEHFCSLREDGGTVTYFATRYAALLSFAVNYAVAGFNVAGYHLFNIFIHIGNALLVYFLVRLTAGTPVIAGMSEGFRKNAALVALASALIFISHPAETQAVSYITQRITSLAVFFYLLSINLYVKSYLLAEESEGRLSPDVLLLYAVSLLSAIFAMKTKEITFTLPLLITLYDFMFFRGGLRPRVMRLFLFLCTLPVIPLAMLRANRPIGNMLSDVSEAARSYTSLSRADYLYTQFRVIVTYLRLILFPINQNLDYDYPVYHSFFAPAVFVSFIVLVSIAGLGGFLLLRYGNRTAHIRLISMGIFWFFLTLSVESSIIPITDVIFEHRVYLPSIGLIIAASVAASGLRDGLSKRLKLTFDPVTVCFAGLIILLSAGTFMRNRVWQDEMRLWSDAAAKSPSKARVLNNLGAALMDRGFAERALENYRTVLRKDGQYAPAHNNMGIAYRQEGRVAEALEHFKAAAALDPELLDVHNNLAGIYLEKNMVDDAIKQLQELIRIRPDFADVHCNLGAAYMSKGLTEEAIEEYDKALKLDPGLEIAHNNLSAAYLKKGLPDKAKEHAMSVIKTDPENAAAHYNLATAYAAKGMRFEADREFRTAVKLNPDLSAADGSLRTVLK